MKSIVLFINRCGALDKLPTAKMGGIRAFKQSLAICDFTITFRSIYSSENKLCLLS